MNPTPSDATKEKLFDEFNTVVAETEQLLKSVATAGADQAGALRAAFEQRLAAAGDRLAKIRDESLDQARAATRATDAYVQGNPWRAVALAGFAGLVVGLLIARR